MASKKHEYATDINEIEVESKKFDSGCETEDVSGLKKLNIKFLS